MLRSRRERASRIAWFVLIASLLVFCIPVRLFAGFSASVAAALPQTRCASKGRTELHAHFGEGSILSDYTVRQIW
jgi:hypothetical protein